MTRARAAAALVLAALALAALAPAAAGAAAPAAAGAAVPEGSVGMRLLDAPADRRDDPRAHTYIVDHLAPGVGIERRVEVANGTEVPAEVALYAAGAAVTDEGFVFAPGRERNALAEWIDVEPSVLAVPAGGAAQATVRIDVPADAAQGERYAVVWAEPPAARGDVTVVNRVGVRAYLSVGPGGEPPSDFAIDAVAARRTGAGVPQVVATVRNTGGRALDLTGEVTLHDGPGGLSAGPFAAASGTTLAVGETAEVPTALPSEIPAGPWQADVVVRSGRTERSASATLTFPAAGAAQAVPAEVGGALWRWVALALLVAAVAALLWLLARRRRAHVPRPAA